MGKNIKPIFGKKQRNERERKKEREREREKIFHFFHMLISVIERKEIEITFCYLVLQVKIAERKRFLFMQLLFCLYFLLFLRFFIIT